MERFVTSKVHRYLMWMADFVACTEATQQAAAAESAPSSRLAQLESAKNAAVAEREEVRSRYEEQVGALGYECRVIAVGVVC